jgi:hypothetical protein
MKKPSKHYICYDTCYYKYTLIEYLFYVNYNLGNNISNNANIGQ